MIVKNFYVILVIFAMFEMTFGQTIIMNCSALEKISSNLSSSYLLGADIDCQGTSWTPIGNSTQPFSGFLNGQGFCISNLTIPLKANNQGLFGCGQAAKVVNLYIKNVNASAGMYCNVGVLFGSCKMCEIAGVHLSTTSPLYFNYVRSRYCCGGLIGTATSTNITNCTVENTIVGATDQCDEYGELIPTIFSKKFFCETQN